MGSNSTNRTGRVSSVDYKRGTYEVTYFDRGRSVTKQINAMSNGEYKMPQVGQVVAVSHSSNGTAQATTTGTVWNESNKPAEGYKGLYRKEFGDKAGEAYERYDSNTGVYTQYAPKRAGRNSNGEIFDEAKGAVSIIGGGQVQLNSTGASVSLQAAKGAGINAGTTVSIESGTSMSIESGSELGVSVKDKYTAEYEGKSEIEHKDDIERKIEGNIKDEITGNIEQTVTGDVTLNINGATITISAAGDISITSPTKIELSAPEINIAGDDGDAVIKTVSLVEHKHGGGPEPDK